MKEAMNRKRNAKIVATLGPASNTKETIQALFEAGADVFRLNFSHGTHADHQRNYDFIREIESELGRPVGVLMDLQGPKLRLGTFADGPVTLKEGDSFRLDLDAATTLFIGTIQGLVMQSLLAGEPERISREAPAVLALYLRGIRRHP